MAEVVLTPLVAAPDGVDGSTPQAVAIADNYIFRNDGRTILHFVKGGAGIATITVITPVEFGGLALDDLTIAVPANTGDVYAGPFNPELYNDGSGDVDFSSDDEAALTVEAIKV